MKTVQHWFDEYAASHKNPVNKAIHWVCIPLIVLSLLGLLWPLQSPFFDLNWGIVAIALALGYYASLSLRLAFGAALLSLGLVAGVLALDALAIAPLWFVSLVIFVSAWIGQFIGHEIEGKKPSFFKDLQFLLIGPLWLLGHLYRRLGIRY